ncbi:MAG: Protein translocase subunit SecE [Candidatus Moanabacter tarae]|uniref:Protein translocase subunit SecE n=1 Tax=Candidatus Moanibacter tarae TaxID=2200854 RepID=A0A2Z4AEF7_9BACT|nr:MAG: Protein translocase subunit SecE [Candidatus Moanabacter tarae]
MLQELKKASWPTRLELRDSTVVVIIAMILLGGFITLSDWSVYNVVTLLTELVRAEAVEVVSGDGL